MCIMTISSESELELVGLMRQGDCFSSDLHYVIITGPGSFMEGGGTALTRMCLLMEDVFS